MENPVPVPNGERRWQIGLYVVSVLFLTWDLFIAPYYILLVHLNSSSRYVLPVIVALLGIGCLLAVWSPRRGARLAAIASALGFVFYLAAGAANLVSAPYDIFGILRFYLPRIFLLGVTFIFSQKVLRYPTRAAGFAIPLLVFKLHWTRKTQKYVLITFMILFGIAVIQWLYPRSVCVARGGRWTRAGLLGQVQYCLVSYPDAGKPCRSSRDCLGACLADPSAASLVPPMGVCAPDNRQSGCLDIFENGETYLLCID